MARKRVSRREFLKSAGVGPAAVSVLAPGLVHGHSEGQKSVLAQRRAVFAALGDTLIPTDPGEPGYKSLETYKITEEVMKGLTSITDAELEALNRGSAEFFAGRDFLQLTESQRADYLRLIIDGSQFTNKTQLDTLRKVYERTRTRVFTVFYQNYPENVIPRDRRGVPILKPGDKHQITNPNTRELVTGWDIAGFEGPLSWEEEEERRAKFKKINWQQ
ncbi:MAG TPA: gluconate 2-dehydrogenase subunit 3 family protein [Pyrinomonadaceae bacterium]|nr:gluconate 2-dehydrogenase subunit 3 family protein [Pyrinomonadaceae bacterium]